MRFVGKHILSRRICRVTMQVVRLFRQLCPYTALLMLLVAPATPDAATHQPEPRLATGVYWQENRCADIELLGSSDILRWCVESVHVTESNTMEFHATWSSKWEFPSSTWWKWPDAGHRDLYLVDDLGRRYDFTATRGAASFGGWIRRGETLRGVFVFPLPSSIHSSFSFKSDHPAVAIEAISLEPRRRTDLASSAFLLGAIGNTQTMDIHLKWSGLGTPTSVGYALARTPSVFEGTRSSGWPLFRTVVRNACGSISRGREFLLQGSHRSTSDRGEIRSATEAHRRLSIDHDHARSQRRDGDLLYRITRRGIRALGGHGERRDPRRAF